MAAPTLPDIAPDVSSPGQETSFRLRTAEFGDGYKQVSGQGINTKIDKWTLSWDSIPDTDAETLINFFNALEGSLPFLWQPPKGYTSPVLWSCVGYSRSSLRAFTSSVSAVFTRWFGSSQ